MGEKTSFNDGTKSILISAKKRLNEVMYGWKQFIYYSQEMKKEQYNH